MFRFLSFLFPIRSTHLRAAALLTVLIAPALITPGPATAAAEGTGQPPLWQITQGEAAVYLFGTVHILPAGMKWMPPGLRQIVETSDTLTVEARPEELQAPEIGQFVLQEGFYHDGQRLIDHLSLKRRNALVAVVDSVDEDINPYVAMKPWLAALTLTNKLAAFYGYNGDNGVEPELIAMAKARGVTIKGLENAKEHLSTFIDLPRNVQIRYLVMTLDEAENFEAGIVQLVDTWRSGDKEALAALTLQGLGNEPILMEALLYKRNKNWVPQIEALLQQPGKHVIAVGAAHLAGEGSVIDLLEKNGHDVVQVF